MNGQLTEVDNNLADAFISNGLYQMGEFSAWLFNKIGLYDEQTNSLLKLKLAKTIFFGAQLLYFLVKIAMSVKKFMCTIFYIYDDLSHQPKLSKENKKK